VLVVVGFDVVEVVVLVVGFKVVDVVVSGFGVSHPTDGNTHPHAPELSFMH